jgi:hypothetical protein
VKTYKAALGVDARAVPRRLLSARVCAVGLRARQRMAENLSSEMRGLAIEGTEMETRHSSPADLYEVIAALRQRREGSPAGEAAASGHCAWCRLIEDPDVTGKTLAAIGCALDNHDLESAVRLLVIHQYAAVEAWEAAEEAVIEYPALFRHPLTSALRDQILADGFVPVPCDRAGSGEGRRLLWGL